MSSPSPLKTSPESDRRNSSPESAVSPRPKPPSSRRFIALLFSLAAIVGMVLYYFMFRNARVEAFNGPVHTVTKERLVLAIVERGTLESAVNSDIICRVKASAKGSTISTTIKWVIDDGTEVVKGQKLIELDDSGLQDQLKNQLITVNKAKADWIQADQNLLITKSQNFSEIETAKTTLVLAEIELKKFLGDVIAVSVFPIKERSALQKFMVKELEPMLRKEIEVATNASVSEVLQTLNDIEGRIEIARSDKEQWLDRASWSMRMVKKGYLSRAQADSDKARLESSDIALRKVQGELDIFRKFTVEQKTTELWSKIKEAERALERVNTQARSKEVQGETDRDSKRAVYDQEEGKRLEIEEEIRRCLIYSPQDGMVVYYVPESTRFGTSSQTATIAQGEPVRDGQKLMRIPNLARMLVNTRIHEAMVSRLKGEVTRPTGFSESLMAAFTPARMPLDLAVNYAVFLDGQKDHFHDHDLEIVKKGQRAFIRVDAYPTKVYEGRVKSVATVASQADFMASDVKVYQTMVSMDGMVQSLKPGMSAEVTIVAEETPEAVLTVPIQSVLGSIASGSSRKVYVLDGEGHPNLREVTVGRTNDKMIEVLTGLNEGEKVVLNPRPLLGEKSDLRPGSPAARRGIDVDEVKTRKGPRKSGPGSGPPGNVPPGNVPHGGADLIPGSGTPAGIPTGMPPRSRKE